MRLSIDRPPLAAAPSGSEASLCGLVDLCGDVVAHPDDDVPSRSRAPRSPPLGIDGPRRLLVGEGDSYSGVGDRAGLHRHLKRLRDVVGAVDRPCAQ